MVSSERPLTIATYAAGASLAAITLVYVFGPTFILDGDQNGNAKSSSRRPAVGLHNPANGELYGSDVSHGIRVILQSHNY
jgi:hypothetical protein